MRQEDANWELEAAAVLAAAIQEQGIHDGVCCLKTVTRGSRDAAAEQIPPPQKPRVVRDDMSLGEVSSFYENAKAAAGVLHISLAQKTKLYHYR